MTGPAQYLRQYQNQSLTPRLQQAVKLLQLSTLEFTIELQQSLASNPFMEVDEEQGPTLLEHDNDHSREGDGNSGDARDAPDTTDAPDAASEENRDVTHTGDAFGISPSRKRNDTEFNDFGVDLAHAPVTLRAHLHTQINVLALPARDQALASLIVEALDDDGYLRVDLLDIGDMLELMPCAQYSELQFALTLVQSLEPAGVACRNLLECLRLQLKALPASEDRSVAMRLLNADVARLSRRDVPWLSRKLGIDRAGVERAYRSLRGLDAQPGSRFGRQNIVYLVPDVIVSKGESGWVALLNEAAVPKIAINRQYVEMFRQSRQTHHAGLASELRDAKWMLRNLEQRFTTIQKVAQAIVGRQQNFFRHGTIAMEPLGLKDIAEELGMHESTVSRATCNKFMSTPAGVFELKYFFSRSLDTGIGSLCSTTAIRTAVREMIRAEDADSPLSDVEITKLLAKEGLVVSRRTITKYRQAMRIPAFDARRRL